jgi:PiT family inorganic phosphate transporter
LLLLRHGRLRLRALQEHLLIVELSYFGIPVSTTHTITGAIVGVGAARKTAAVRWNVASDVILAWIVTLPAAALFGAAFYQLYKLLS